MDEAWENLWGCTGCFDKELQKIFYGYGDVDSAVHLQKVMFLFMNPGGDTNPMQLQFVKNLPTMEMKTEYCRVDVLPWLFKHREIFIELIKILVSNQLINGPAFNKDKKINEKIFKNYCESGDFFRNIYLTDAIKCKERSYKEKIIRNCYLKHLKLELSYLNNLKLVIAFGKTANNSIDINLNPIPTDYPNLHLINNGKVFVIKTRHPSDRPKGKNLPSAVDCILNDVKTAFKSDTLHINKSR